MKRTWADSKVFPSGTQQPSALEMMQQTQGSTETTLVNSDMKGMVLALSRNNQSHMHNLHVLFHPAMANESSQVGVHVTSTAFPNWCINDDLCSKQETITTVLAWYNNSYTYGAMTLGPNFPDPTVYEFTSNPSGEDELRVPSQDFSCFTDPNCGYNTYVYLPSITVLSGILEIRLVYEGRSHAKLCEGDNVPGCTFDIQIPIEADKMVDDRLLKCVRLEPAFGTHMVFEAIANASWVHPVESQTPYTVTCTVDTLGKYMIVQEAGLSTANPIQENPMPSRPPAQPVESYSFPPPPHPPPPAYYSMPPSFKAFEIKAAVLYDKDEFDNNFDFESSFKENTLTTLAENLFDQFGNIFRLPNAPDTQPCYGCIRVRRIDGLFDGWSLRVNEIGHFSGYEYPTAVTYEFFLPVGISDTEKRAVKDHVKSSTAKSLFDGSSYIDKIRDIMYEDSEDSYPYFYDQSTVYDLDRFKYRLALDLLRRHVPQVGVTVVSRCKSSWCQVGVRAELVSSQVGVKRQVGVRAKLVSSQVGVSQVKLVSQPSWCQVKLVSAKSIWCQVGAQSQVRLVSGWCSEPSQVGVSQVKLVSEPSWCHSGVQRQVKQSGLGFHFIIFVLV